MSQIIVPSSIPTGTSNDVLLLNMVANGTITASGSDYDLDIGDDNVFATMASRGTSISLDATDNHKLNLTAGLYEITFNGWVQTSANVTGSLDYQFKASSNPIFANSDVAFDRMILDYDNVLAIIDPSHTTMLNVVAGGSVYFRVSLNSGQTWFLRGDATSVLTQLQIRRIGDAA